MPCTKKEFCIAMKAVLEANTSEHGKGIGWQMYINLKTGHRWHSLVYRTKAGYAGKIVRLNYCPWCAELLSSQGDDDMPKAAGADDVEKAKQERIASEAKQNQNEGPQ